MSAMKSAIVTGLVLFGVASALWLRAGRQAPPVAEEGASQAAGVQVPTLVELGSDKCTSCRAMIPVIKELESTHGCNVGLRSVDVWQQPELAKAFRVKTIPTQVLLGPDGEEIARHSGFWSATAIRAAFAKAGHELSTDTGDCTL